MMDDEVVRRRSWLSREEFLDLLGATNLIPGPNSTEMAIHVGHRQAGWAGLLVGGICFILPASLIVTAFAWAYVTYGSLPEVAAVLYGIKPVIIAIVLQALLNLGHTALKTTFLLALGAAAVVLAFVGVNELLLLLLGGARWLSRWLAETAPREDAGLTPGRLAVGAPWERRRGRNFSDHIRPVAAFLVLLEGRIDPVRKRLCAARVHPGRPCPKVGLADRNSASGCGGGRTGHARTGLHHRDVHRLFARRSGRGRDRDGRHLSAGVFLRRRQRSADSANPELPSGRSLSGRRERRLPRAHVRRDFPVRAGRAGRYSNRLSSRLLPQCSFSGLP